MNAVLTKPLTVKACKDIIDNFIPGRKVSSPITAKDILNIMASHYEILQIDISTSDKEVKQAYHRLALQYHPDKAGAKHSDAFKTIAAAYEVLGKPEKRTQYNWEISNPEGHSKQFSLRKRKYQFLENPENYNLYDFINAFFDIPEHDKLKPGFTMIWE